MPDPTPHKPTDKTRAEVSALVSFGVTQEEIGKYLGIHPQTLRGHYREELDKSVVRANAAVARVLFEKATIERETSAVLFWLKTRAGWRETDKIGEQLINLVNELQSKFKEQQE